MARLLLGLAFVLALVGCGPQTQLAVYNVDRDPVRILVNGIEVGRLSCFDRPLVIPPAIAPFPWRVEIFDEPTGEVFGVHLVDGQWPIQALLIRQVGLIPVPPTEAISAAWPPEDPACPGVRPEVLPRPAPTPAA